MNLVDIIVVGVLLLSGLAAFMRGFVHEVLSVTGWVGAATAALYGVPYLSPFAQQYLPAGWMADAAAGFAIFLVVLVLLSLITHAIAKRIRDSALNSVDRSLGFLFGIVRGALVVCLAYILGMWFFDDAKPPEWLATAKTRPAMDQGAEMLVAAAPEWLVGKAEGTARQAGEEARKAAEAQRMFRELASPRPAAGRGDEKDEQQDGYGQSERNEMDRLFRDNQ